MKEIGKKLSHWLFSCFIGGVFPILFFLLGWWGSIGRIAEEKIFLVALVGLLWGTLLNYLVLRRILNRLYSLPIWILCLIYAFYSICIYGFFMGFPLFNLFLAIPAGLYMGVRYVGKPLTLTKKIKIQSALFTSFLLLILCSITSKLALGQKTFGKELQNMLNLSSVVTRPMLIGICLIGSVVLIIASYGLTAYYFSKANRPD
jgi:hypothetical protein